MKKAGFVAATAAGFMMLGGTAAASPADVNADGPAVGDGDITYEDAFHQFNNGGGAAGYGAASLVSSAYTGIALTPALAADSFSE
ncbi:hypothetical protein SAMN06265360_10290 [Haloechinothrix alba]|uniref:Secreted protein n=1 Tax=Haloechinothrix alba TaxID=664784 RepID=A0A238VCX1_9PSEU|nr:hypothetical protein [Haloechinothrix alba]SNR32250.1 hypothetical protein SAMN06265360_10290 [Haloechinothrix alba]